LSSAPPNSRIWLVRKLHQFPPPELTIIDWPAAILASPATTSPETAALSFSAMLRCWNAVMASSVLVVSSSIIRASVLLRPPPLMPIVRYAPGITGRIMEAGTSEAIFFLNSSARASRA